MWETPPSFSDHMFRRVFYFIALFAVASAHAQSKSDADPLKSYASCRASGDLQIKEVARRDPKSKEKYREVSTDKGTERVSVLDGYRVMFGYSDLPYYFANVKIELSDTQNYEDDKRKVIAELKRTASEKAATKITYLDKTLMNGLEHYGLDREVIDIGGTIGIHVLFYDSKHLIVTAYLLNQGKEKPGSGKRRFHNIDEYRGLRDDFLNRYAECLKSVADTQP